MGAIELKNSLIERFNKIIKDDSKLMTLDGFFDSMNIVEYQLISFGSTSYNY